MTERRVDEATMKALVLRRLRRSGVIGPGAVIASEFRIGNTGVRADIAVLAKKKFIGIEVKSDLDSLRRLPTQANAYSEYFDRFILVTTRRHSSRIKDYPVQRAEIWTVDEKQVVSCSKPDAELRRDASYTHLLSEGEYRRYLRCSDPLSGSGGRDAFIAAFRARHEQTSQMFWEHVQGRQITPHDLAVLSRFRKRREVQKSLHQARAEKEKIWIERARQSLQVA